jgi:hypothetical protein
LLADAQIGVLFIFELSHLLTLLEPFQFTKANLLDYGLAALQHQTTTVLSRLDAAVQQASRSASSDIE